MVEQSENGRRKPTGGGIRPRPLPQAVRRIMPLPGPLAPLVPALAARQNLHGVEEGVEIFGNGRSQFSLSRMGKNKTVH
jgi:hypothetical protein